MHSTKARPSHHHYVKRRSTLTSTRQIGVKKPRQKQDITMMVPSSSSTTNKPAPTPSKLFDTRQLHPYHVYGADGMEMPKFERAPLPTQLFSLDPKDYKPTHIQYISGYQFIPVPDVAATRKELLSSLKQFNALGRIYLNEDGVNLQMCVHPSKSADTIHAIRNVSNNLFKDTRIFANDIVDGEQVEPLFDAMHVIHRPILNDGLNPEYSSHLIQHIEKFNHLSPAEWHEELKKAQETKNIKQKPIILDIRNLYEYELGSFKNSIAVDVDAYRDTFQILDTLLGIHHPIEEVSKNSKNDQFLLHDDDLTKLHDMIQNVDTSDSFDNMETIVKKYIAARDNYQKTENIHHVTKSDGDFIQRSKLKRNDDVLTNITHKDDMMELQLQKQTLVVGRLLQHLYSKQEAQAKLNSISDKGSVDKAINPLTDNNDIMNTEGLKMITSKVDPNTKLLLYCTGGIRCLKVGSYLHDQGFTNINVLNGGVNQYAVYHQQHLRDKGEESMFDGANVVFDNRRAVRIGKQIMAQCHQCSTPTDIQRNCENQLCDVLFIQCKSCEDTYLGTCSVSCSEQKYGLGDIVRENIHNRSLKGILLPPSKNQRIRPRLNSYSITSHAKYLEKLQVVNHKNAPL